MPNGILTQRNLLFFLLLFLLATGRIVAEVLHLVTRQGTWRWRGRGNALRFVALVATVRIAVPGGGVGQGIDVSAICGRGRLALADEGGW
eukprot:scaffold1806_cov240-Pinguiococcus_pyrenoidosus.AAC.24